MTGDPSVARAADVAWALFDDEVLCYRDGALHRLGPVASAAWLLLAEPQLVRTLVDGLQVDELDAAAVAALLLPLRELGLVTVCESTLRQT